MKLQPTNLKNFLDLKNYWIFKYPMITLDKEDFELVKQKMGTGVEFDKNMFKKIKAGNKLIIKNKFNDEKIKGKIKKISFFENRNDLFNKKNINPHILITDSQNVQDVQDILDNTYDFEKQVEKIYLKLMENIMQPKKIRLVHVELKK